MKKKSKTRILLILIVIIPLTIQFSRNFSYNSVSQIDPNADYDEKGEENNDKLAPTTATPDFINATKSITKGSQDGPPFNLTDIKWDDNLNDSTNFGYGIPWAFTKEYADTIDYYTGSWGTNSGDIATALKDDDGNDLYVEQKWDTSFPDPCILIWSGYNNFDVNAHTHVFRININFEVWVSSTGDGVDESTDLKISVWDNADNMEEYLIAADPQDSVHYTSEGDWFINSGDLFDNVKSGGYITKIKVEMMNREEIFSITRINIDWVNILYWFWYYAVDFFYELDYGGYGLTTITEFDVTVDLVEIVPSLNIFLYNYNLSQWDKIIANVASTGRINKTITLNADDYFDESKKLRIRFDRRLYYDIRPPWEYHIKIDQIKIDLRPPDAPSNVEIDQNIEHVFLNWDIPNDNGVPITHYNVYRGLTQGGIKSLIGSPSSNEFNDTTGTIGIVYYYTISAINIAGESENSTEVSGKSYAEPFVEWISPKEGDTVIFPFNKSDPGGSWVIFNFHYDYAELYNVTLKINSISYGSVFGKSSIRFYPYFDGPIIATLYGWNETEIIVSDTVHFTSVRITYEHEEMLDFNTKILGTRLYLILHDPNGDHSYSSFTETTILSMGVGYEITSSQAETVEIGASYDLFIIEVGASTSVTEKDTEEEGFDFRFEVSDATSLTSNLESSDPDFIGPGYGDIYWGESWIFKWVLNATWRLYSNATERYEDPKLYYGILRDVETIANDLIAPEHWRNQNPIHNNWANVQWLSTFACPGGPEYTQTYEVTTTLTRTNSFEIEVEESAAGSIGIAGEISITENTRNYVEQGQATVYETSYVISDDEPSDYLVQGIGIDKRFGTYIFNTSSFFCETSYPLEHNTFDYIPPIIEFPNIDLDSNDDNQGPCPDDSPIITVDIFDEGGITDAIILYSIDNGTVWNPVYLSEQLNNPGTWENSIPAQEVDTEVQWYIVAWDYQGSKTTKMNGTGLPFKYTVISKRSAPSGIPGYPIIPIISFSLVTFISIIIIFSKKLRK